MQHGLDDSRQGRARRGRLPARRRCRHRGPTFLCRVAILLMLTCPPSRLATRSSTALRRTTLFHRARHSSASSSPPPSRSSPSAPLRPPRPSIRSRCASLPVRPIAPARFAPRPRSRRPSVGPLGRGQVQAARPRQHVGRVLKQRVRQGEPEDTRLRPKRRGRHCHAPPGRREPEDVQQEVRDSFPSSSFPQKPASMADRRPSACTGACPSSTSWSTHSSATSSATTRRSAFAVS